MRRVTLIWMLSAAVVIGPVTETPASAQAGAPPAASGDAPSAGWLEQARVRLVRDLFAMRTFRPAYPFWQNIFTIPDGHVAFGSAIDGRLLASFPVKGDWAADADWTDPSLADVLDGHVLSRPLDDRRDEVTRLLEAKVGPVFSNPTRGLFLIPNERRYGAFLSEWGAIYERFGVPADVGLAQAILESGLNGRVRSEARAIGFCQWLTSNWNRLKRLAPDVIEGYDQTTQAPYCAAYLSILATKYGSFIPALSEHHTGGANLGRVLINGEWLGGTDVRERYFRGSTFVRELRAMSPGTYSDIYGTYGLRSSLYAEMVFGNMANVTRLLDEVPQETIYAMRTTRAITLAEIERRAKLSADEIRRFNPALVRRVPAHATLYLPRYVAAFGRDVSYWHRPAGEAYSVVLNDFVALNEPSETWDTPAFAPVLETFRRRFAATKSEEGTIMATTLAFFIHDQRTNRQAGILADFRSNERILRLFEQGRSDLKAFVASNADAPVSGD